MNASDMQDINRNSCPALPFEVRSHLAYRRVGRLFEERRTEWGLRRIEVAQLCGYRNGAKGVRRVAEIEAGNLHHRVLVLQLMTVLALRPEAVAAAGESDDAERRERFLAARRAGFKPQVTVRWIPGIYLPIRPPRRKSSPGWLERYAIRFARQKGVRVHVRHTTGVGVWFTERGELSSIQEPRDDLLPGDFEGRIL